MAGPVSPLPTVLGSLASGGTADPTASHMPHEAPTEHVLDPSLPEEPPAVHFKRECAGPCA